MHITPRRCRQRALAREILVDPGDDLVDGLDPHAELDHVERHGRNTSRRLEGPVKLGLPFFHRGDYEGAAPTSIAGSMTDGRLY